MHSILKLSSLSLALVAPLEVSAAEITKTVAGDDFKTLTTKKHLGSKHHKKDKHHHHCMPARPICKFFVEPESADFWRAKPIHEAKDLNVTAHPEVAKYGIKKPWYFAESDFNVTRPKHHRHHHGHHDDGKHNMHHGGRKYDKECCKAMTAECLACAEGITPYEYCLKKPDTVGCKDVTKEKMLKLAYEKDEEFLHYESHHNKTFPWEKIPYAHQICAFGHKRADGLEERCEGKRPEEFECHPEPTYFACECISEEDANVELGARAFIPYAFSLSVMLFCSVLALCVIIGVVRVPRRMGGDKDKLVSPPGTEKNSEAGDDFKKVITVDGILIHQKSHGDNVEMTADATIDSTNAAASTTAGSYYPGHPAVTTGHPVFATTAIQEDEPSAFTPAAPAYVIPSGQTATGGLYPEADTVALTTNPVVVHVCEGNHNAPPAEEGLRYAEQHNEEFNEPAGPSNAAVHNAFAAASDHNQILAGKPPLKTRICCSLVALFPGFAAVVAVIALFPTSGIYYNGC